MNALTQLVFEIDLALLLALSIRSVYLLQIGFTPTTPSNLLLSTIMFLGTFSSFLVFSPSSSTEIRWPCNSISLTPTYWRIVLAKLLSTISLLLIHLLICLELMSKFFGANPLRVGSNLTLMHLLLIIKPAMEASYMTPRGSGFKASLGILAPPLSSWLSFRHFEMASTWQRIFISTILLSMWILPKLLSSSLLHPTLIS